ncbi:uncharacterized protein PSFLO_02468 [Pseudozyma flocculosa]|uniref:Uncharacterized protein n=1 Tax=Pseudozyma flocculosa TaxID=84751 RepID=A0A5C3EZE3_9BASI|nr:uncharacterized protein PSFLO_02468 [Pseudozyma flocculosa]
MPTPSRQASDGNLRVSERDRDHGHSNVGWSAANASRHAPPSPGYAPSHAGSSSASAFDLPGHSLFLSDPHRLSVLSLTIDATTAISQAASPASSFTRDLSIDHAHPGPIDSPRRAAPPSASHAAYQHPTNKRSSLAAPETGPRHGAFRPKSVEIGLRAREAFTELGRRAREAAGNLDRSPNVDALSHVTQHLNPDTARVGGTGPLADAKSLRSRPTTSESHGEGSSVQVRRRTTAKLQSLTFGRDSRLTTSVVPLDLETDCQLLGSCENDDAFHGAKDAGSLQRGPIAHTHEAIAFVADPSARGGAQPGAFSAAVSESGDDGAPHSANQSLDRTPFDPSRLLLKIEPPAEHARRVWARRLPRASATSEEVHSVDLRFRLRLCASAEAPSTPLTAKSSTSATSWNNANFAQSSASKGLEEVLFVSADSSQKLVDAIDMASSALTSAEAAALEGVSRVVVNPSPAAAGGTTRGARDCDFEWKWKPMRRSETTGPLGAAKGPGTGKCCCAFVEVDAGRTRAKVLAAFSFWVDVPAAPIAPKPVGTEAKRGSVMPSDSLALIAAWNQDPSRSDLFDADPGAAALAGVSRVSVADDGAGAGPAVPHVDHTEISLADLESDSPILRAAIANLDRRSAALKRVAKAALKAAHDARMRILASMEAEDALDEAMRDLAALAPNTLSPLRQSLGDESRERTSRYRREQATMLEQNIERPLAQVLDQCRTAIEQIKSFEAESKAYYSQTQKWLSSRVVPETGNSAFSSSSNGHVNGGGDRSIKQERADEKQRLRQLRFDHARLDLYRILSRLHGGQAELELTRCMLRLSNWQASAPHTIWGPGWPGPQASRTLADLTSGVEAAGSAISLRAGAVKQKCDEVAEQIRLVELGLKRAGEADTGPSYAYEDVELGGADVSTNPDPAASEPDYGSAKGAKQAGQKIRNFLASKASGGDQGMTSGIRRKVSLKVHSSRPAAAGTPIASPSLQSPNPMDRLSDVPPRDLHSVASPRLPAPTAMDVAASSRAAVDLPKSPLLEHVSNANEYLMAYGAAPASLDVSRTSSSAAGLGIGGLNVDTPSAAASQASSGPSASRGVPKQVAPGQERKKEGVLWAMSKPVTGPAGSDAPRAVNRSNHWRECWVVLSGSGHIGEYADWKDAKVLEPSNPLIDLRFATVREARGVDRRFAFEVVTRDSRRFFQAPDEATMRDWMKAIAKAIESLLNGTSSVRKLDRAVRATPFTMDPALQSGAVAEDGMFDDFGAVAGRSDLEHSAQRPFSQSMTDLAGETRDVHRAAEAPSAFSERRREGRRGGRHASTLSESYANTSVWKQGSKEDKPKRSASKHERGISNKTPIYGYLDSNGSALGLSGGDADNARANHQRGTNISEGLSSSSFEGDSEFDRRIEEIVQSSFGKSSIGSPARETPTSAPVSEMGKLQPDAAQRAPDHGSTTSTKMSRATEIIEISHRPENSLCADCRAPDPRWASWALGNQPCCIFICISCSGVHRSLGVHLSKVKSVDLDDWTEEQVEAARQWGNVKANELWEHSKPAGLLPAEGDRQTFWRKKYIEAAWKRPTDKAQTQTPSSRTPRASAPAAMAPTPDRASVDRTPTRLPKVRRSASGSQAPAAAEGDEAASRQTSPKPSGPRPLPPSRSGSFAEHGSSGGIPFRLSRARQTSDSGRGPIKLASDAPSAYGFAQRPGYSSRSASRETGVQWPSLGPIDLAASRSYDHATGASFFVSDLSSTSPTTYESAARTYKPADVHLHLREDALRYGGGNDDDDHDGGHDGLEHFLGRP